MKILIPLLALFSLQSSIAQTRYVTLGTGESVELKSTDIVEIVGVAHERDSNINFTRSNNRPGFQEGFNVNTNTRNENFQWAKDKDVYTGLTLASVIRGFFTLKITEEAVTNYEELDEIHQAIYDEILLIYQDDKEFIEYLQKSQRAWIKFRDAHIFMTWPALETKSRLLGSAERMSVPIHLATLTQARIDELLKWSRGLEEGHVDRGTIKLVGEIKAKEKKLDLKAR